MAYGDDPGDIPMPALALILAVVLALFGCGSTPTPTQDADRCPPAYVCGDGWSFRPPVQPPTVLTRTTDPETVTLKGIEVEQVAYVGSVDDYLTSLDPEHRQLVTTSKRTFAGYPGGIAALVEPLRRYVVLHDGLLLVVTFDEHMFDFATTETAISTLMIKRPCPLASVRGPSWCLVAPPGLHEVRRDVVPERVVLAAPDDTLVLEIDSGSYAGTLDDYRGHLDPTPGIPSFGWTYSWEPTPVSGTPGYRVTMHGPDATWERWVVVTGGKLVFVTYLDAIPTEQMLASIVTLKIAR